jgi:selenocysteine lyase/cysteine desulfurase
MKCQKHLFNIPDHITYLNCARRGPQSKRLENIGIAAVKAQSQPFATSNKGFFEPIEQAKVAYAQLIDVADPQRIALIPSASYGISSVANNIQLKKGEKIIITHEQFPSNVYPWMRIAERDAGELKIIKAPDENNRGKSWNQAILEAIDDQTKVVSLGNVHWTDGTWFDLKAISKKAKRHGALLIIDGTQSVGALPFSVAEIQPDALICGSYKWMMGPYSLGLAYFGPAFDNGVPIEENWINRLNSNDFTNLVNYQPLYRPKAQRYSVGEQSSFILLPLLLAALGQLNDWGVENIQQYCKKITKDAILSFREMGLKLEKEPFICSHLFGIRLPDHFDGQILKQELEKAQILVSFRGTAMRVAPNIYNDAGDLDKLVACFKKAQKRVLY